ncbi:MAG: hypothetical protein K2X93_03325 [Candidatus Obscuribacterales bacterium]|nr:hypothetical protein [Candidatus Obscuribacterales bacterium]
MDPLLWQLFVKSGSLPDQALKDINKALLLENNYSDYDVKSRILIVKRSYRAALAELDRSWSAYTKEFDDPGDRDEFDGYERAAALFALEQDVAANSL